MYLWLDLETTGLDPNVHSIIECAAILTTPELEEVGRVEAVVRIQQNTLWDIQAAQMHLMSGLVEANTVHPTKESRLAGAANVLDGWLSFQLGVGDPGEAARRLRKEKVVLAGNSVHFDRKFLEAHCPRVCTRLSHRHFDISVLRELSPLWWPDLKLPVQAKPHRAMADIEQALDLARFFKNQLGAQLQ